MAETREDSMEFLTVAQARKMPGVKLVQTQGFPGPWGQAVRKMLNYKKVPYVLVAQQASQDNTELVDWIGIRNAPALVDDPKRPATRWLDQIMFVEKHKPEPALLPRDSADRATTFGICNEIAGEWGYGWCRRLLMMVGVAQAQPLGYQPTAADIAMATDYGFSPEAAAAAPQRCADIQNMLAARLKAQRAKGSKYLVGNAVTAADIYWTAFSILLDPPAQNLCPMPQPLHDMHKASHPLLLAAKDPILMEHRDMMFATDFGPMEF
jgi:glutathione S-transferase